MTDANDRDSAFSFLPTYLNEIDSKEFITFCGQSSSLISGSVMENIFFGSTEPDMAKLEAAVEFACLTDFVIERGLDFELKDSGENLSGGEKARIGICRAFYNNESNVMLFDEPTASLDSANSLKLIQNIASWSDNGGIAIVVSHDPLFDPYVSETITFVK